jgi:hypothetical protein
MDVAVTTTGRRIEDRLKLAGVKKLPLAGGIDGRQRQRRQPPDRAPLGRSLSPQGMCLPLMGSGIGSAPFEDLINAAGEALRAARSARLYIDTTPVALKDVNQTWNTNTGRSRVVFVTH